MPPLHHIGPAPDVVKAVFLRPPPGSKILHGKDAVMIDHVFLSVSDLVRSIAFYVGGRW
ncbi:MAG: hypothetical protein ACJAVR_002783 [Paracoccaceae bacterium]|jgi:hypothetical protein